MRHYAQMYGVNARLGKCGPGGILSPDTPTPPGSLGHTVNPERVPGSGFIFVAAPSPSRRRAMLLCSFVVFLTFNARFPSEGTNRETISERPGLLRPGGRAI